MFKVKQSSGKGGWERDQNHRMPWESWHHTQTSPHTHAHAHFKKKNPSRAKTVSPCWKLLGALGIRNPTIKHMGIKIIVSCCAVMCVCMYMCVCVVDRWIGFSKEHTYTHAPIQYFPEIHMKNKETQFGAKKRRNCKYTCQTWRYEPVLKHTITHKHTHLWKQGVWKIGKTEN